MTCPHEWSGMGVRQAVNPHPDRDGFNCGLTYGRIVFSHQVLPHLVVCPASSLKLKAGFEKPWRKPQPGSLTSHSTHRVVRLALREWAPGPVGVLANSALDQRPNNLGNGDALGVAVAEVVR